MTNEIKEMNNFKQTLELYKHEKTMVHLVLKNRRFYNGLILELRESMLILQDNKIGRIFIPVDDLYLIESFHEPKEGEEEGGGDGG